MERRRTRYPGIYEYSARGGRRRYQVVYRTGRTVDAPQRAASFDTLKDARNYQISQSHRVREGTFFDPKKSEITVTEFFHEVMRLGGRSHREGYPPNVPITDLRNGVLGPTDRRGLRPPVEASGPGRWMGPRPTRLQGERRRALPRDAQGRRHPGCPLPTVVEASREHRRSLLPVDEPLRELGPDADELPVPGVHAEGEVAGMQLIDPAEHKRIRRHPLHLLPPDDLVHSDQDGTAPRRRLVPPVGGTLVCHLR